MEQPTYTALQDEFIKAAKEGRNIFLTGKAGTGKSFIVRELVRILNASGKKVVAIAPTGIAANNIGGQTIHSLFSINPYGVASYKRCNFMREEKKKLIKAIDTIIIDEVSMLRPDTLDAISWTLIKNDCGSLLHKQVIFVGDLKQLPPVLDDNTRSVLMQDYEGELFSYAQVYKHLDVHEIELTEVLRQSDNAFIRELNMVREGFKSDYFKQFVADEPRGVILAPHNATVEKYNRAGLAAIDGPVITFDAQIEDNVSASDFNLPSKIQVKNGAKIMHLINSPGSVLLNGTIGTFIVRDNCYFIRVGSVDYVLNPVRLTKKEYMLNEAENQLELREIGSIEQYPIKLAYALSIHKAQGLTFDEVTVDLSRRCFQKGQLYVALSRVRSPEGLRVILK